MVGGQLEKRHAACDVAMLAGVIHMCGCVLDTCVKDSCTTQGELGCILHAVLNRGTWQSSTLSTAISPLQHFVISGLLQVCTCFCSHISIVSEGL